MPGGSYLPDDWMRGQRTIRRWSIPEAGTRMEPSIVEACAGEVCDAHDAALRCERCAESIIVRRLERVAAKRASRTERLVFDPPRWTLLPLSGALEARTSMRAFCPLASRHAFGPTPYATNRATEEQGVLRFGWPSRSLALNLRGARPDDDRSDDDRILGNRRGIAMGQW